MEGDPLLIQAEQKLIDQADELVVLVDSSKFRQRSSLILCGLSRITTVITDEGIEDREAKMLEAAGVALVVAPDSRSATGGNLRCEPEGAAMIIATFKGGSSMSIVRKLLATAAITAAMFVNPAYADNVKIALVVKALGHRLLRGRQQGCAGGCEGTWRRRGDLYRADRYDG